MNSVLGIHAIVEFKFLVVHMWATRLGSGSLKGLRANLGLAFS